MAGYKCGMSHHSPIDRDDRSASANKTGIARDSRNARFPFFWRSVLQSAPLKLLQTLTESPASHLVHADRQRLPAYRR
ncbi:hypothetical protein B0G77_8085 [Paraburkholderia sp. BL10I2N1]|nr:hypothetical protein B0G77_8085 [Paraburkholderia sp. BL10I2N1]